MKNKKPTKPDKDKSLPVEESFLREWQLLSRKEQVSIPLHHPEILIKFAKIDPSYPERILSMVEKQHDHRIGQEKKINEINIENARKEADASIEKMRKVAFETYLGQGFAFICYMTTIVGGIYASLNGAQLLGSLFATFGVGSVIYSFIQGRKQK